MTRNWRAVFLLSSVIILVTGCASGATRATPTGRTEVFWSQPPAAIKMSFTGELLAAIAKQRDAWKAEETRVHGEVGPAKSSGVQLARLNMMHCHVDGSYDGAARRILKKGSKLAPVPTLVASENQLFGVCPNWPSMQDSMHRRRASKEPEVVRKPFADSLISGLDSARRSAPDEAWFLRQLVRVLTENGEFARARVVLDHCANEMWCGTLDGYLEYVQGNLEQASAAWARALIGIEASPRCALLTTDALIPMNRDALNFTSCLDRAWFDQNVWWLSKPLFSDSINYRLVEHVGRGIRNALVTDLPRDVHYDLRPAAGGDAVSRMRLRYGWPTHSWWPGQKEDEGHQEYVRAKARIFPIPPYSSPEYSRDMVTTTPSMFGAQLPFTAKDADFAVDHEMNYSEARPWPQEFFRHPNGVLLYIRKQQNALLRRDSAALLVAAVMLPSPPRDTKPDSAVSLQLLSSSTPVDVRQVSTANARWGSRAFLSGELRRPSVIGLEVNRGGARIAGARTRFGVPVIPSHANSPASCAVSDPILMDASALAVAGTDKLQRGMLADLALRRPQKLGLLWESYGLRAGDSVTIAVRVTGVQDRSGLARAVQSLGLVGQQEIAIAVSWSEPSPARQVETIPSRVPTLRRELTLDVASLRSGTYGVQVTMKARGCDAVSPVRQFTVTR